MPDLQHRFLLGRSVLPARVPLATRIGRLAIRSLYREVALAAKPGLVTPWGNGSHDDMDYATFTQLTERYAERDLRLITDPDAQALDAGRAEQALLQRKPGRTTVEAVERGCLLMMRGFVLTQLELAREYWGEDFEVFLTGGDASLVRDMVPDARVVQDLVFVGLAVVCPLP